MIMAELFATFTPKAEMFENCSHAVRHTIIKKGRYVRIIVKIISTLNYIVIPIPYSY